MIKQPSFSMASRLVLVLVTVLGLLFSGCSTNPTPPVADAGSEESGPTPTQADTPSTETQPANGLPETSIPTAVLAGADTGKVFEPDTDASPTPGSPPLRFVFPTPGPAPVSAWRPPLYSIPWAPTPYDHFYFSRPIGADQVNWPLPDYRYGGIFFGDVVHTGVDIPAPIGTPVLAAASGRVVWAGYGLFLGQYDPNDPYGLAVAIRHEFGYQGQALYTLYGHMSQIDIVRGQIVTQGEVLGLVGDTGQTTGPHLHFEVRLGENLFATTRNPELWIAPPQGWGLLVGRVMNNLGELLYEQPVNVRNLKTGQTWVVFTYGPTSVNADAYYRENVVLGDLPAGDYIVWLNANGLSGDHRFTIEPGLVTYFTFGREGKFSLETPAPPQAFVAPDSTASP